jgi:hypothetical protein
VQVPSLLKYLEGQNIQNKGQTYKDTDARHRNDRLIAALYVDAGN